MDVGLQTLLGWMEKWIDRKLSECRSELRIEIWMDRFEVDHDFDDEMYRGMDEDIFG